VSKHRGPVATKTTKGDESSETEEEEEEEDSDYFQSDSDDTDSDSSGSADSATRSAANKKRPAETAKGNTSDTANKVSCDFIFICCNFSVIVFASNFAP